MQEKTAVAVLTRVPAPGRTKTRMMPQLTPMQCVEAHICFLKDVLHACARSNADVFVFHTPEATDARMREAFGPDATYLTQEGDDLGARMRHAAGAVFARGYEACVLAGADAPELEAADLREAFSLLREKDAVIGPTFDGGFYLIGMSKPQPKLLDAGPYGTPHVLERTLDIAEKQGLACGFTRRLHDMDTWEDLQGLAQRLRGRAEAPRDARRTAAYLARLFPEGQPPADAPAPATPTPAATPRCGEGTAGYAG